MEVQEAPERPIEARHEGDGAGLATVDAAGLRLRILPPGDLLHEEPILRRQRGGAQGEHPANFMGRREDPLPHRDTGQHVIDEVSRRPAHSPRGTTGARSTTFAGEAHEDLLPTRRTYDPQKSMGVYATAKVAAKLLLDIVRELFAPLLTHGGEKGLEVLAHQEMQRGLLGPTAHVGS